MPSTTLIADEHVDAFLRDLSDKLHQWSQSSPHDRTLRLCVIGKSGYVLAQRLGKVVPASLKPLIDISVIRISQGKMAFDKGVDVNQFRGARVIVLDSSVHSGATMRLVCRHLGQIGAAHVVSYSLVLKCSSGFVPTGWGILIGPNDRALFLLSRLPNSMLRSRAPDDSPTEAAASYHLERIATEHATNEAPFSSGESLIDQNTWHDRLTKQQLGLGYHCYLLYSGSVLTGFVGFEVKRAELHLHEVAVHPQHRRKGFGSALIHWAERYARECDCTHVSLEALPPALEFYRSLGYAVVEDRMGEPQVVNVSGRTLTTMRRPLARGHAWRD